MNPPEAPARQGWRIALALLAVLALTLGGVRYLTLGLSDVRAEIPQIEASKLREGFIALGDLNRLQDAMEKAAQPTPITASRRRAVVAALDFLYLRADSFRLLHSQSRAEALPELVGLLDRIVTQGDAALAGSAADLRDFAAWLDGQVHRARAELVRYVDAQHQAQIAAIAKQKRSLERMTIAATFLMTMFGFLSGGAVLLLNAELRANRKRMAAEEKARQLAYFDPLTGLLNRARFNERGEEMLADHAGPALVLLDLDNFKVTNDTHGHAAGDAVLRSVAQALLRVVGEADGIAARLGGDEFAALLPGPFSPEEANALGARLIRELGRPVRFDGLVLTPKCCLGICRAQHLFQERPNLSRMLKSADLALYEAKGAGRDTFRLFDGALAAEIADRRQIEEALPRALEADELRVAFQPQYELATGRLYGVEALVRWQRGDDCIQPARFIPAAEETGLICDIDVWVLRTAAHMVAGWLDRGVPELRLSVNLSSLHFRSDHIVEQVHDVLLETGLPPNLVTLEITETVLIESKSRATDIINRLHGLGVQVSLDDFGTGYSGLGYLQEMRVDEIKIDRSFVSRLAGSDDARLILQAVVGMAKGLGMTVVAEGIETETQTALVEAFGCDIGQGFRYARPLPAEEFGAQLLRDTPGAATKNQAKRMPSQ